MISVVEDIACQRAAALINEALGEDPKRRDELATLGEATVVFNLTTGGTAADTAARLLPLLAGVIPETISTILLTLQHGELSLQPVSGVVSESDDDELFTPSEGSWTDED